MLTYKPHIIHLGKGEWACGRKLKGKIRGGTAISRSGAGWGRDPSAAYAMWLSANSDERSRNRLTMAELQAESEGRASACPQQMQGLA